MLARRFKNRELLALFERILAGSPCGPGAGLPIGALTSQHFANAYLDAVDRFLLERLRVAAHVRYMDDIVWWCGSRAEARAGLAALRAFSWEARRIEVKAQAHVGRSAAGLRFLGFRVRPGKLALGARRRRRFQAACRGLRRALQSSACCERALQRRAEAAVAITLHARAAPWRRACLARQLPVEW